MLYFKDNCFNSYLVASHMEKCGFGIMDFVSLRQFIDRAHTTLQISLFEATGSFLYAMLNEDVETQIDNIDFVYYGPLEDMAKLIRFFSDEVKLLDLKEFTVVVENGDMIKPEILCIYQFKLEKKMTINVHCLPMQLKNAKQIADTIAVSVLKYARINYDYGIGRKPNFRLLYSTIFRNCSR